MNSDKKTFRISKLQSQMLMGLAVPMFMYHHMFYVPSRMHEEYFRVLGSFQDTLVIFLKMTLTIFTFVSGYGAWRSLSRGRLKDDNKILDEPDRKEIVGEPGKITILTGLQKIGRILWQDIKYGIIHTFKLLQRYWLVFAIFIPIGLLIGDARLSGYPLISVKSILGLDDNINAEWWYIKQFYVLMISLPMIDLMVSCLDKCKLLTRRRVIVGGCVLLGLVGVLALGTQVIVVSIRQQLLQAGIFGTESLHIGIVDSGAEVTTITSALNLSNITMNKLTELGYDIGSLSSIPVLFIKLWSRLFRYFNQNNFCFVSVFAEGYLCARYELFDSPFLQKKNVLRDVMLGISFILGYGIFRTLINKDITFIFTDFLFAVPFVYGVWLISNHLPKLSEWIAHFFGDNATYIWLTHTFFCYYYFQRFIMVSHVSTVMFLQLIVVTFLCSRVITLLQDKILGNIMKKVTTLIKR